MRPSFAAGSTSESCHARSRLGRHRVHRFAVDPGSDTANEGALTGGGSTHAWADVFIPGAGWIEFDPTNRIVAGRNLVRVATTRTPAQAVPVSGTYRHDGAVFLGMNVEVSVTRSD